MPCLPHTPELALLCAEIDRSFGSMEDLCRALNRLRTDTRRGGFVDLLCTHDGALRLLSARPGAPPRPGVLLRVPCADLPAMAALPLRALAARYARCMQDRPPCPMP